jgi:hypothetical protein
VGWGEGPCPSKPLPSCGTDSWVSLQETLAKVVHPDPWPLSPRNRFQLRDLMASFHRRLAVNRGECSGYKLSRKQQPSLHVPPSCLTSVWGPGAESTLGGGRNVHSSAQNQDQIQEGTGSSCLLCSSLLRHHAGVGTFEEMLRKGRKPPTLPQLRTLLPEKHPGARGRKFLAPFTHQGSKSCVSQTEKFSIMDRSKRFLIPAPQRPRKFKASLLERAGHRASAGLGSWDLVHESHCAQFSPANLPWRTLSPAPPHQSPRSFSICRATCYLLPLSHDHSLLKGST